jgi:hypothetical protein
MNFKNLVLLKKKPDLLNYFLIWDIIDYLCIRKLKTRNCLRYLRLGVLVIS